MRFSVVAYNRHDALIVRLDSEPALDLNHQTSNLRTAELRAPSEGRQCNIHALYLGVLINYATASPSGIFPPSTVTEFMSEYEPIINI